MAPHTSLYSHRSRSRRSTTVASAIVSFWTIVSTFAVSSAEVIHVPGEQPTIQAAVDIAAEGDTILVAPGTYIAEGKAEEVVNLLGKAIRLESTDGPQATIIDGENRCRGLLCNSGEELETVVDGFTFTNCRKADGAGANFTNASPLIRNCTFSLNNGEGLWMENSSASLETCIFSGNQAPFGAGLHVIDSNPVIDNCQFIDNWGVGTGGGGHFDNCGGSITNCTFLYNVAGADGAIGHGTGLYFSGSSPTLRDCVFQENSTTGWTSSVLVCKEESNPILISCVFQKNDGGAISCSGNSSPTVNDCMFIANDGPGMACSSSNPTLNNCVFQGDYPNLMWTGMHCYSSSPTLNHCNFLDHPAGMSCVSNSNPTLNNCVFERNRKPSSGGMGGGVYCNNSSPTLNNCTFKENSAAFGGGVGCDKFSNPILIGCLFQQNSALGGSGGGMACDNISDPILIDCLFEQNTADGSGGGMYNTFASSPTFSNCVFEENSCFEHQEGGGGGMYSDGGSPIMSDCVFQRNSARNGGGVFSSGGSSLTLEDCLFQENIATGGDLIFYSGGGGIYHSSDTIWLNNCTFTGNSAENGGGMYTYVGAILENCTFTQNFAYGENGEGGGISCGVSTTLNNCVFQDNSAELGGGLYEGTIGTMLSNLTDTVMCGSSAGGQVFGEFHDHGGNCFSNSCSDEDDDGWPDACSQQVDLQAVLEEASEGEAIVIPAGRHLINRTLDPLGKALTIKGEIDTEGNPTTIIDGQGVFRIIRCVNKEGADTVLENLIITGGFSDWGAGMDCIDSSPTLRNCIFQENSAKFYGSGMHCSNSNPNLQNCHFLKNETQWHSGGGMANWGSNPTLENCVFQENSAGAFGGHGGGMYNSSSSNPILTDTTLCGNSPEQVYGPFTDNGGNCIQSICSNCEEGACPTDLNGDGITNGVDLGLFFVAWASCALCPEDFNGDGEVNSEDLGLLIAGWGACQ